MRGKFEAPRGKPSGRHLRRKRTSVRWKPLVLVLTLVLVVGCVAGGSLAWLTDRAKASAFNCARVKKFARLCLANINNPYDMQEALQYEPDVIEV